MQKNKTTIKFILFGLIVAVLLSFTVMAVFAAPPAGTGNVTGSFTPASDSTSYIGQENLKYLYGWFDFLRIGNASTTGDLFVGGNATVTENLTVDKIFIPNSFSDTDISIFGYTSGAARNQGIFIENVDGYAFLRLKGDGDDAGKIFFDNDNFSSASIIYFRDELVIKSDETLKLYGGGKLHFGENTVTQIILDVNQFYPETDSFLDLGKSNRFFDEIYGDRVYLNPTAYLDGETTAGVIDLTGNLTVSGNATTSGSQEVGQFSIGGVNLQGSSGATLVGIATDGGSITVDQLQEYFDNTGSTGFFSGGTISDGGSGTIDVTAGEGFIRTTDDDNAPLLTFAWSASTTIDIIDDTTKYVYVDYNGGSPKIVLDSSEFAENNTKIIIGVATDESASIESAFNLGVRLEESIGAAGRYLRRVLGIQRNNRKGGLILGQSGDNNRDVTITTGDLEWGRTTYPISAFNTSGDTFWTYSASGQESNNASQWPNEQFDNGGTLETMGNNKWAVLWWWVEPDDNVVMVYGTNQYVTMAQAEEESVPATLPNRLSATGFFIGRFIFQKSDNTATIETIFDFVFSSAGVTDHGNLAGLGDDDHPQYGNLSQDENVTGFWTFGSGEFTDFLTVENLVVVNATTTNLTVKGNSTTTGWLNIGTTGVTELLGATIGAGDLFVGNNATVTNHFTADATLYVKDSNVGIGTDSPVVPFHIFQGSAGTISPQPAFDNMVIEDNDNAGFSLFSPDTDFTGFYFGSASDDIGAQINWNHDDDLMRIGTHNTGAELAFETAVGVEAMRIDSSQNTTLAGDLSAINGGFLVTAADVRIVDTIPRLYFQETGVAADEGIWGFNVQNTALTWRALTDDESSATTFLNVARTGTNIDSLTLTSDSIVLAGVTTVTGNLDIVGTTASLVGGNTTNFLIQDASANGIAGLRLKNDVQEWRMRVSSDDTFQLVDITNSSKRPFYIVSNSSDISLRIDTNGVIVNELSTSIVDFRVETNTQTHALFVDAGNDRVGINDSSPDATLDVGGDGIFDGDLTVGGQTTLTTGTADNNLALNFTGKETTGFWVNNNPDMRFVVGGNLVAVFANDRSVRFGTGGTKDAPVLRSTADGNSGMFFPMGDAVALSAGGVEMLRLSEGDDDELVVNFNGVDLDFRVRSDFKTHALFVQSSDGNVGIGDSTPDATLDVGGTIQFDGDLISKGTAPSLSSCGSGFSIIGTDTAGIVSVGTGLHSNCTVTFATAYSTEPVCVVTGDSSVNISAKSTSAFTMTGNGPIGGATVNYICIGL